MAYKVIILYRLYMPSYFLGTFTEYPSIKNSQIRPVQASVIYLLIQRIFFKSIKDCGQITFTGIRK